MDTVNYLIWGIVITLFLSIVFIFSRIIGMFVFLIFILLLVLIGVYVKPKNQEIDISVEKTPLKPFCKKEKVECETNNDCKKCNESRGGEEIVCVKLERTPDQEKEGYGTTKSYCAPKLPTDKQCIAKNGGIWTWTGWSSANQQDWECLCTYPNIAGDKNTGCSINPNVCQNGQLDFDATSDPPKIDIRGQGLCRCGEGSSLIFTQQRLPTPLCVPTNLVDNQLKRERLYSNSEFA